MGFLKYSLLLGEFKSNTDIWLYIFIKFAEEFISISMLMFFYIISIKERIIVNQKKLFYRSITCVILLIINIFISILFIKPPYVNIVILILSIVIFRFIYNKKIIDIDFYPFMFLVFSYTLIYGLSYLFKRALDIFLHPQSDIFKIRSIDILCVGLFFEILMILIFYVAIKSYLKNLVYNFKDKSVWKIMLLYPAIITLISFFIVPYYNSNMKISRAVIIYIIFLVSIFIITFIIYYLYYSIARYIKNNKEVEEKNAMLQIQTEQYNNLNELIMNNRKMKHDFKQHLIVIKKLIDAKNYDYLKNYINEYIDNMPGPIKAFTSCLPLNAILTHYESNFKENNIKYDYEININDDIDIDEMDLCVLVGNLLENSLLASLEIPISKRYVSIKLIKKSSNIVIIRVKNKFDNKIIKRGEEFISTRHEDSAFGLRSVKNIVNKYNGKIKISHEKPDFIVEIILVK